MSKVADKIMACVHGGSELRELLGYEPNGHVIIENMEDLFGEKWHSKLFTELAHQIRQEEFEMRGFCERVEGAAKDKEELDLFGVAYIPLPTDVDGVQVEVGDMLQGERCGGGWCEPFEVDHLRFGFGGWWTAHEKSGIPHLVDMCRHYHATTVEDVLREFATDWECANDGEDKSEVLDSYAAKLRLKDES